MLSRFWNLFRRKRLELDLDAEVSYHIESLEAEHRASGLSDAEGRYAARRDFGGLAQIKEVYRDQRGIPMLENLWRDVRFGLRSMQRGPEITLAVLATRAIAIAANTTIFSVVYGVLIKPLPYPDSDRLIVVEHALPQIPDIGSSPFLYLVERDQNQSMEGVGLLGLGGGSVTGIGEPEQVRSLNVTSDILPILGVPPLLGREFSNSDMIPGSPNTIILTYGYWRRRFGGDPRVIGHHLTVNSEPYEIIGVMPRRFWPLDNRVDVIYPIRLDISQVTVGNYFWRSIGRLKLGVTLE